MGQWHNTDKDNITNTVNVLIRKSDDNKTQYCAKCGKTRYDDFTYIGTPQGMYGWSENKICPTCGAKVEINHPDSMGGWGEDTVYYLNEFIDQIETKKY